MHRRRYERNIDDYMSYCYAQRTVARVSELADLLNASRPYVSKVIVRLFGKTPHRILRERKLAEACRLLRVTTLSVEEVAIASAFGTGVTLFRAFRDAFGMTPGEYRRKVTSEPGLLPGALAGLSCGDLEGRAAEES